jgi:hypothetical protein
MINIATVNIGDKVCYQPEHLKIQNKFENGIIKEIPEHSLDSVRVVYNCGGDWKNYKDYTSALTNCRDLELGWKHNEIEINLEDENIF